MDSLQDKIDSFRREWVGSTPAMRKYIEARVWLIEWELQGLIEKEIEKNDGQPQIDLPL